MAYLVKEIFYSLQGEGYHAGRPATFIRFCGCNLWNGKEESRSSSICSFCDTDFLGTDGENGGVYTADELVRVALQLGPRGRRAAACPEQSRRRSMDQKQEAIDGRRIAILTGGEPLLQVDEVLIQALHDNGFYVAVETNGTKPVPKGIDWVCVSPKWGADVVVKKGDELKLVYPQKDVDPQKYLEWDFKHFYLQPCDDKNEIQNRQNSLNYCLKNPIWQLSLQLHKIIGIK